MSASKLVKPSLEYRESFIEALAEYHEAGLLNQLDLERISKDYEGFVEDLCDEMGQHHQNLEPWAEKVRETVLWLVKDTDYIGFVKIRHRVNWHLERFGGHVSFSIRPSMRGRGFGKKLLQRALPSIHALGIERALITIAPDNHAARRIIEFCGGTLQDQTSATDRFPAQMRFWIVYD